MGNGKGVILNVIPLVLDVNWEYQSGSIGGRLIPKPNKVVEVKDVTFFQPFCDFLRFELGDYVRYKTDVSSRSFEVMNHRCRINVQWNNGEISYHIPSCELVSLSGLLSDSIQKTSFWPAVIVWERSKGLKRLKQEKDPRYGVVQRVHVTKGLVEVRWWNAVRDEYDTVVTCSVDKVIRRPKLEIIIQDIVLIPAHCNNRDLSWFGDVTDISKDGTYTVHLGNDETIALRFHELEKTRYCWEFDEGESPYKENNERRIRQTRDLDESNDQEAPGANDNAVPSPEKLDKGSKKAVDRYGPLSCFGMVDYVDPDLLHFKEPRVRFIPIHFCKRDLNIKECPACILFSRNSCGPRVNF
jgi:uncharacterized protein YlbG (UPF0298 family)